MLAQRVHFNFHTHARWPSYTWRKKCSTFSSELTNELFSHAISSWSCCFVCFSAQVVSFCLWFRQNRSLTLNFIKFIQTHRSQWMLNANAKNDTQRDDAATVVGRPAQNLIYANSHNIHSTNRNKTKKVKQTQIRLIKLSDSARMQTSNLNWLRLPHTRFVARSFYVSVTLWSWRSATQNLSEQRMEGAALMIYVEVMR